MTSQPVCRFCLEEDGPFVSPCRCRGSVAHIHEACLNRWLVELPVRKWPPHCPICATIIPTTATYEAYFFGEKPIRRETLIFNMAAANSLIAMIAYAYNENFYYDEYHLTQAALIIIYLIGIASFWLRIQNQRLFWRRAIGSCGVIIMTIHLAAAVHLIINGRSMGIVTYQWFVTMIHLLMPIHIREINLIVDGVNDDVAVGGVRWNGVNGS